MSIFLDIGLTGGIACGRSLALSIFKALGCSVLDADEIYHDLIVSGKPLHKKLVKVFGDAILDENKEIKRDFLAEMVFNDEAARKKLNSIAHPAVVKEQRRLKKIIRKELKQEKVEEALIVTDAALMIESGTYKNYDKVIVVASESEIQLQRLMKRNSISEEEARKRIISQMPVSEKIKYADYVIFNNGTAEELVREVESVHAQIFEELHRIIEP